jgi:hypothetical protein
MDSHRKSFGMIHFADVKLGDQRRNRRLPQLVDAMLEHPGGTLPEKLNRPQDLEAFYRLCDAEEVTHAAVLAPHRALVLQHLQSAEHYLLVVHDATELDYSSHFSLSELGQIGNGHGRGYVVQNSLVVDPQWGTALGLANQLLHVRPRVSKREKVAAKRRRASRESRLWPQGTAGLPSSRWIVDVCDRGADGFEFLEHECRSGRTFVIRAHYNRNVLTGHAAGTGEECSLVTHARSQPARGTAEIMVRVPPRQEGRTPRGTRLPNVSRMASVSRIASLSISFCAVRVKSPHVRRGEHGREPLPVWVVRVWEENPPRGTKPLEWFLMTNHPVIDADAALLVKAWYEWRWVVEEYHKGLKTGCGVEKLQLRDETRLEPAIAVLSVVALNLLQLRDAARQPDANQRRADQIVAPEAIKLLSLHSAGRHCPDWTIEDYYIALAQLGGYRRRRGCPPGWLVLWRGQTKLDLMLQGAWILRHHNHKRQPPKCAKS